MALLKRIAVVVALAPALALAQGVVKPYRPPPEDILCASWRNAAMSSGGGICGAKLPSSRSFSLQTISMWINVVGGGGAGNTVVTFTDGTNNCTFTLACATSASAGVYRVAGAGSCVFPPNASITGSVTTAGCTTTQPTLQSAMVLGNWR
jgi:hypothetical protein